MKCLTILTDLIYLPNFIYDFHSTYSILDNEDKMSHIHELKPPIIYIDNFVFKLLKVLYIFRNILDTSATEIFE